MAFGYMGVVFINSNQYLVTSADLSDDRPRLESEATYAATSLGAHADPVGKIHVYDFTTVTGTLNIEANTYLLDELFADVTDNDGGAVNTDLNALALQLSNKLNCGGWVKNRRNPRHVLWYNNKYWSYDYGRAFWTTLSLGADEAQFVTCSLGLDIITDPSVIANDVEAGGDYIGQKFGIPDTLGTDLGPGAGYNTDYYSPLEPLANDKSARPLPYWATSVETTPALPAGVEVKAWSIDLNNNLQKRYSCSGETAYYHPGPAWIYPGTAELSASLTFVAPRTNSIVYLPSRFSVVDFVIGDSLQHGTTRRLRLENVENNKSSSSISQGDITTLKYDAGSFFRLPRLV